MTMSLSRRSSCGFLRGEAVQCSAVQCTHRQGRRTETDLRHALEDDPHVMWWDEIRKASEHIGRLYLLNILSDVEGAVRRQRGIFLFSKGSAASLWGGRPWHMHLGVEGEIEGEGVEEWKYSGPIATNSQINSKRAFPISCYNRFGLVYLYRHGWLSLCHQGSRLGSCRTSGKLWA